MTDDITCPACGAPDFGTGVRFGDLALCDACDTLAPVDGEPDLDAVPASITMSEGDGELRLSWEWSRARAIGQLVLTVAWSAGFAWMLFEREAFEPGSTLALGASIAPYALILFGVSAIEPLVALFNRTFLVLDREAVRVTHRPIPWMPSPTVARSDIRSVRARRVSVGRRGRRRYEYALQATNPAGGASVRLATVPSPANAAWLAALLQARAGSS